MKYQNTCTKCYAVVGGGGESNDKVNADSSHTNMLVIFVNYSKNFSLTTKMNHNEIKKSLSFKFDSAMDWQHARRGPCLLPNVSRPKLYMPSLLFPYVFVSCSKFWVNLQVMTKLFHRNIEQFRFLMWHHTHIVQELSAILDLIQSLAAMEKSGGYWL